MTSTTITFRGQEVSNPIGRFLVVMCCLVAVLIGLLLIPVLLIVHFPLRALGFRGTVWREGNVGGITWKGALTR